MVYIVALERLTIWKTDREVSLQVISSGTWVSACSSPVLMEQLNSSWKKISKWKWPRYRPERLHHILSSLVLLMVSQ
ncbi:hypothetical protein LEMLEM_LOCUS23136 [Lemmus lemmus]